MVSPKKILANLVFGFFLMALPTPPLKSTPLIQEERISRGEYDDILQLLSQANRKLGDYSQVKEVCFTIREDKGALKGILIGYDFYGSFMIDILFIKEPFRNQGYGSALLDHAEAYARSKKMRFVSTSTMSFWNAVPFYEKNGFEVEGTSTGFEKGLSQIHLRKYL